MPTRAYDEPFYTSTVLSSDRVPSMFPVALDGHEFVVDLKSGAFGRQSIALLRQQADTSQSPSEASINPEDLWRRSADTWTSGTGQERFDGITSSQQRARSSKNVNVWTEWRISLLNETVDKATIGGAGTGAASMVAVGDYLYWCNGGTNIYYTNSGPYTTWAVNTLAAGAAVKALATDGSHVYAIVGSDIKQYDVPSGAVLATYTHPSAAYDTVAFIKGRLMATAGANVYNITAAGAAPAALLTPFNTGWRWVGFAEGTSNIYFAGYAGDKSAIYRTTITSEGTSLTAPVVAGELPDGEVVSAISGYLGFVIIGTTSGFRVAEVGSDGGLVLGQLVNIGQTVRCFEPQDRFVYFGWENFDSGSSGLGRMDLSKSIGTLTPAYASDLMTTGTSASPKTGYVDSVCTWKGIRVFTVRSNTGSSDIWAEGKSKASSGYIDSGLISYGLVDEKQGIFLDVVHKALEGSLDAYVSYDEGDFMSVGRNSIAGAKKTETMQLGPVSATTFEVRLVLTRGTLDSATGPIITRWTLRSYPAPFIGQRITVPLVLHETVDADGQDVPMDVLAELSFIEGLNQTRRMVVYQEGLDKKNVIVDAYEWRPSHRTSDGTFFNGLCLVSLKTVSA